MSVTYSECVFVGLGIQRAMRMRRVILSSVPCLAVPRFFHVINGTVFGGKNYGTRNVCFDFLYNFCLKHFSL